MTTKTDTQIKILVVDDEPFILNVTSLALQKLGYKNIDTAADGEQAFTKLKESDFKIDLIILDLNMPVADGIDFMHRASEANYVGGLILYSGEDRRLLETALELASEQQLNILGTLPKPLQLDELETLLASFANSSPHAKNKNTVAEISKRELLLELEKDQNIGLTLFYQPKVNVRTGQIIGVEALSRWNHTDRGLLGPASFIPLAERTNLIDQLSYRIYEEAVKQCALWKARGHILSMSVNFSINSFSHEGFTEFITSTTEKYGLSPTQIILEVTETQVMTNTLDCLEVMMRLRMKNKFGLSIDDFGTAHSSLEQLKRLPFTELKIDRAYVHGASTDSKRKAILEASVALAKKLNLEIVAEGVENKEEWNSIKELGTDIVQGYFCAKPMSNEDFLKFYDSWQGPLVD